jgi:drug/metabolite transporter (DMT)-like permease
VSRARVAELALVGVAAVWGLTFTMVQDAIERIPVTTFLAYRFLAAAALVALAFHRDLRRLDGSGWRAGLVMGVFLTAGYLLQTFGLEHTTASSAGFITGLFVVITPLLGALFLRQRVGGTGWTCAAASAAGLFLLAGVAGGRLHPLGDALVLGCAVAFSAHILATGRAAPHHAVGALVAVQLAVCGLTCFVVAAAAGDLQAPHGATVWSALAVTAIVASALGFFVQTYAQRHAPPSRTALILASEPAFAGLFGYLLAGDRLSPVQWLGAALIVAAIVAVDAAPRLRPARPLPEG